MDKSVILFEERNSTVLISDDSSSSISDDLNPKINFRSDESYDKDKHEEIQKNINKISALLGSSLVSILPDKGVKLEKKLQELKDMDHSLRNIRSTHDKKFIDRKKVDSSQIYKPKNLVTLQKLGERRVELENTTDKEKKAIHSLFKCLETQPNKNNNKFDDKLHSVCEKYFKFSLKTHQISALSWMLNREHQCLQEDTFSGTGGILADDMGLGKTLTTIALIVISKHQNTHNNNDFIQCKVSTSITANSIHGISDNQGPTLIICPASIIHQWENEIKKFCVKRPKVLVYHGSDRTQRAHHLSNHDIVISTYNLAGREQIFQDVPWHRIILDEGHYIKNPKCITSIALCRLQAKYRWILTGTPIHNELKDLYSLIKFLRVTPFDNVHVWKRLIGDAINSTANSPKEDNVVDKSLISSNTQTMYNLKNRNLACQKSRLALLLRVVCMRRTKQETDHLGQSIVPLPPRTFQTHKLVLNENELDLYTRILRKSQIFFKQLMAQKEDKAIPYYQRFRNQTNVLVYLLRIRQCCCHPVLLKQFVRINLTGECEEDSKYPKSINEAKKSGPEVDDLEKSFANLSFEKFSPAKAGSRHNGSFLNEEDMKMLEKQFESLCKQSYISTKIKCLLKLLNEIFYPSNANPINDDDSVISDDENGSKQRKSDTNVTQFKTPHQQQIMKSKCVIVSQWTSFLNVLKVHLARNGFSHYQTIDGSTKPINRTLISRDFNENASGAPILLLSLQAGGVGLNLVGANHMIFLDSHWNPALEAQASDRIYRIGQTRPVTIHRLLCKQTVEEKIVALQTAKQQLAQSALINSSKSKDLHHKSSHQQVNENYDVKKISNHGQISNNPNKHRLGLDDIKLLLFNNNDDDN